jgi:hypothetical protein
MAKFRVSYEIGSICDSQEFDDENEAQKYYSMMQETAYVFESEGGADCMVEIEEIIEDEDNG